MMRNKTTMHLAAMLIVLLGSALSAFAQAAVKTDQGFLFIYNGESKSFTLEIKGKDIKPIESEQPVFVVDGRILQILTVPVANFLPSGKTPGDDELLEAHKIWESDYLGQEMYKQKLVVDSQKVDLAGRKNLLWGFTRPAMNQEFNRDYFLTTVLGNYLLALGSSLSPKDDKAESQKFLKEVAQTLKVSDQPFDVEKIAAELRKAPAKP